MPNCCLALLALESICLSNFRYILELNMLFSEEVVANIYVLGTVAFWIFSLVVQYPFRASRQPVVDLLSSASPAQFESQYPESIPSEGLKNLLLHGELELLHLNKASTIIQARQLLQHAANDVSLTSKTAFDLAQNSVSFLKTGLSGVDRALLGGLRPGTVSELAGPAGCGKTQLCCQLAAITVLSPEATEKVGVLYVDTENSVSANRIVEIGKQRFPEIDIGQAASRIYLHRIFSSHSLAQLLGHTIQEIIILKNLKLVIIDSIASLIRKEFESRTSSRSEILLGLASALKELAESFDIAVVVVNQVQTLTIAPQDSNESERAECIAVALGNTWCHTVNTRLTLQYTAGSYQQLTITKSPVAPVCHFRYKITVRGLVEAEDSDCPLNDKSGDPSLQPIRGRHSFL
ncbi:DNA repair protein RAD51 homolog 2-like [Watersipora subatra]|uniref:DNA repair protein RAD51 homolog 2-like n=1 Tax=Watersipora subatra TaxID=2589382 RepID=UPI00355BE560